MEEFSARFFEAYPGPKQLVALRRGQRWLPLFAVLAVVRAWRARESGHHIHLGDGMLAPLAPALRLASRSPLTVTVHGQEITRRFPLYQPVLRAALRQFGDGVVAVSSYTARQAGALYGVEAAVITNGVDTARFSAIERAPDPATVRTALGLPPYGPLIVTVGRLVRRKGVAWFIRQVLPRLPGDVVYAVIGDGPDSDRVARAAAGDARAVLMGNVPAATIDVLYSCADMFVAPNIRVPGKPEGYGIAPAEAAAAGLPVLVADIEGLRDMAMDTGVRMAPSGDASIWANAVIETLSQPGTARARYSPRSWQRVTEDYARVFAAVGGGAPRRSLERAAPTA